MKITCTAFVLLIQTLQCLASDDSPFTLRNKDTGFCLVKLHDYCLNLRWTTGQRLMVQWENKCLGVQGKSVGSEVQLYECDENSDLQKWECKNGTVLALKDQQLYIELTADNTAVLSRTIGPNNHLTIEGTSSGACSRTHRELYTIGGNANGRPCMFPFLFQQKWHETCTTEGSSEIRLWCAVETKYEHELWGYCPVNTKEGWKNNRATGEYYQLNTQSALTWRQAEASCKQQSSSLLSITDPHQQAYVTVLLEAEGRGQGDKLWTGMIRNQEHGWHWSNGRPYRYLNWDSGHPVPNPGHDCGVVDAAVLYSWQSSSCTKRLGYICYVDGPVAPPSEAAETGFCSSPWIPYNNHCMYINRTRKSWSDAQKVCHKEGGNLVSIHNVEEQSFVIAQLGYALTDELWIGLNDKRTQGLFEWSDHSTVSFTSWESGNPAVSTDREDCVLIRGEDGNWADRLCDERHGFICMKMTASEPSGDEVEQNIGCKTGWKRHGSYCYFVGTETKNFDEAKDHCKSSDSYLADISNGVDNAFLVSLVGLRPEKYFWLGLSNQENIDRFVWTNTDLVKFTHWNAEMPGHQQGCVAMTTGLFAGLWDLLPCTNKEKYICKHLAEGAALTPVPPTAPILECADGWTRTKRRNICYKFFSEESSEKKTWFEARDYCRAIGGDLLSIHNNADINMRGQYHSAWIGLHAPDPDTGYIWSDGSPVDFQQWSDGQPDNTNAESCAKVYMGWWVQLWYDEQCEGYNSWLCQIRAGRTPKPPPDPVAPDYNTTSDGWLEWNGTQYYINTGRMAMEDARHFCQQRHGDLVTINSEAERRFLWKQTQLHSENYFRYWIGLRVELDGTYEWMDGSQMVFQKWYGQPEFKYFDENCVYMMSYGAFWHNSDCGKEESFICKRSGSTPANTTAAPTLAPKGGCNPQWKKFNSKCYRIINNQNLTWQGAREQCQDMGGNLASIPSRHVQVFLMTQMADTPTTDLWIGFRSTYRDTFMWTDGKPNRYLNLNLEGSSFLANGHSYYYYANLKLCAVINTRPALGIGKWIPKSCNDTNGFVCHRNVDPSSPDSAEPTTSLGYVKLLNDSFKLVTQQMNWDAAKKHCEGDGAKLASLRTQWSNDYVELLSLNTKAPLWIGMNKLETKGYFRFIDGWHMTFANWGQNEPSKDRPCVYMDVDGKWKTAECKQTMNSVCMKSTDVPPTESSDFPGDCPDGIWQPFQSHCYTFFTEEKNWPDASASCRTHGGWLASIADPFQQEFIQSRIKIFEDSHNSFWIGLFHTHKGEWLWLDKTVMDYNNWDEGQPIEASFGGITTSNGNWTTGQTTYKRPYICKTLKVLHTTVSTSSSPHVVLGLHRSHVGAVAAVGAITGIAAVAAIVFFLNRKSSHRLPTSENLTNFDNPLFFSSEQSQPDMVDTNTIVVNAEEESPEP